MYCYHCGKEIPESVKFCPYCGTEQNQPKAPGTGGGKKKIWRILRRVIIVAILVPLVILGLLVVFAMIREAQSTPEPTVPTESITGDSQSPNNPTSEAPVLTESQIPEDGWHTENGERYYICDGEKYVDLQEIDGKLYYFDESGVLAVNRDVDYDAMILHANRNGCLEGLTIKELFGTWAEKPYRFGNGGSSSVLELPSEVENCDSFRFCLEATGMHGARVNGTWKIYIRHDGKWEYIQSINYTQPKGYFDIDFEEPKTFDAITAHPTVEGNASYSSLFYLQNVHCIF